MQIHIVKEGDTLYSIGKNYGVTVERLLKLNGPTVQPTLIIGQAVIVSVSDDTAYTALANGYAYPFIDRSALLQELPYLSVITPFCYGISEDFGLLPLDDGGMVALAENANVPPVLMVTTLNESGKFSPQKAEALLSDEQNERKLINAIVEKAESGNYFGVDVDFEYVPERLRDNYTEFIRLLRSFCEPLGIKVLVALAPKTSDDQPGLLYEAHDYRELGYAADYCVLMTYEWGYTYGPPMAVAPIDKVEAVVRYACSRIQPSKILMGIPNYAYDWMLPFVKGEAARSMSNNTAISQARTVGAEIKFDSVAETPYYNYYGDEGREHVVWFEDARSVKAKASIITRYSLGGYSIWNLMAFYTPMMQTLRSLIKNEDV